VVYAHSCFGTLRPRSTPSSSWPLIGALPRCFRWSRPRLHVPRLAGAAPACSSVASPEGAIGALLLAPGAGLLLQTAVPAVRGCLAPHHERPYFLGSVQFFARSFTMLCGKSPARDGCSLTRHLKRWVK